MTCLVKGEKVMFERYDIESLYSCTIEVCIPWSIENIGGCISIISGNIKTYKTIVCYNGNRYVDIFHLDHVINVVDFPCEKIPSLSYNGKLYVLNTNTLKKYSENLTVKEKNIKSLQRLPFKRKRLLTKEK